ncbi:MAG: hypothetical protein IJS90_00275 [Clostridia bacterium]|nr:hypothetical protein [Clostridia bacterium]
MKKQLSKGMKIFLVLLIVAVLLGACFLSVALYAKHEFEKERSWLPPEFSPQSASVTELPDNAHDAYEYAMRLYDEALHSGEVEGSWHTDVDLGGDMALPFDETDSKIVNEIRSGAAGSVQSFYPSQSGVKMSDEKKEDLPVINLKESDIIEYVYEPENVFNRKGEYKSDTYEIVFKVDPAFESIDDILNNGVYDSVCEALKSAVTVKKADVKVVDAEVRFRIDRLTDRMLGADVSRGYEITADVSLTDAYSSLITDGSNDFSVVLPYRAAERVSFMWYGLHFLEDYMEQRPNDIVTLPIDIYVNGSAMQGTDFDVEYIISDPSTMEIDSDSVMTVNKTNDVSATEGVKVTASLSYNGKTYTDDIVVYITELEKTTTGVRFWKDGFTVETDKQTPLPVEIRVPVNEQSDLKTEEEYTLTVDVSDPDLLSIEVDGKELYAIAHNNSSSPVTVKVRLDCGGHTYFAELPVTIIEGKEATDNG